MAEAKRSTMTSVPMRTRNAGTSPLVPITLSLILLSGCAGLQQPDGDDGGETTTSGDEGKADSVAAATDVTLPPEVIIPELQLKGPSIPDPLQQPTTEVSYDDAWDRMRSGFTLPERDNGVIRQQRDYFAQRPDYMVRVSERAAPWMHYILEAVEARDMPTEIALVPVVESAFRPFAYSHGRASGIWQIVPVTARHMNLKRNWWYDGRRDVIAATEAALGYLERLGERYDGDWLLALAAYNAGEGTVSRAMRRNRRAGEPTDFWHLNLPTETERYVPRILALRDVITDPSVYGLDGLPEIANEPGIEVVDMEHQLDLANAADMMGVSVKRLYQLNPGFNRWATPPEGPHRLAVPADKAKRFRSALADADSSDRMQWRRHEVAPGETLSGIANAYQTRVEVVREANDLDGNTIRVGQDLVVPVASRSPDEYVLSASQRLASKRQHRRSGERRRYTVRQGDSFWSISRRFDVSVRELSSWNGMSPGDTLRPGDELVVWAQPGNDTDKQKTAKAGPENGGERTRHEVRKGENLWVIAREFDVDVNRLAKWNGMTVEETLQPGEELIVWTDNGSGNESASTAEAAESGPNESNSSRKYVVEKGDSLWSIAVDHDMAVSELAQRNGLSKGATLQPGQELVVEAEGADNANQRAESTSATDTEADDSADDASGREDYTVRKGDSLYRIAREFDVTVDKLRQWNDIAPDSYLQPGQTLRMKVSSANDG